MCRISSELIDTPRLLNLLVQIEGEAVDRNDCSLPVI
jgi:hypothetical protein